MKSSWLPTLRSSNQKSGYPQWCPGAESNHRHCDFQSHALPTELPGHREHGPLGHCPEYEHPGDTTEGGCITHARAVIKPLPVRAADLHPVPPVGQECDRRRLASGRGRPLDNAACKTAGRRRSFGGRRLGISGWLQPLSCSRTHDRAGRDGSDRSIMCLPVRRTRSASATGSA